MATLAVQELDEDGIIRDTDSDIFVAAATAGDEYINNFPTVLVVKNTGAASRTVTITAQKTSIRVAGFGQDITISNISLVIDAADNQDEAWVVVPTAGYNDGDGKVQITYSSETDLKVCAFKLANVG